MSSRVHEAVKAIALCHNVTPVYESNGVTDQAEAEKQYEDSCRVYQASSPDEVNPRQRRPDTQRDAVPVFHVLGSGVPRGSSVSRHEPGGYCAARETRFQMCVGLASLQNRYSWTSAISQISKEKEILFRWPVHKGSRAHLNHTFPFLKNTSFIKL